MVAPYPIWVLVAHQVFLVVRHQCRTAMVATIEAVLTASPLVLVVYLGWGCVRLRCVAR